MVHPSSQDLAAAAQAMTLEDLRVETTAGIPIVDEVTLRLGPGEVLGLVGESGSGKTTTALSLFGYTPGGARIARGTLSLAGHGQFALTDAASLKALRGRFLSYVPQSPGTSLNPAMRIGALLREMQRHRADGPSATGRDLPQEMSNMLTTVGLPTTKGFLHRFPHQLSGGQQQRVCVALALLSGARLVVLDEPTTGLDVITQASVLEELHRLQRELSVSMVYISHDLAVVGELATAIAVMYAGKIVEVGPADQILSRPAHPYTHGLLSATPDHRAAALVQPMPGVAPSLAQRSRDACSFAPRCPRVTDVCLSTTPELRPMPGRETQGRCHHPLEFTFSVVHRQAPAFQQRSEQLLAVEDLTVAYVVRGVRMVAAAGVSFSLARGDCLAVVGESGSGKTSIARAIAGIQQYSGEVRLHGHPLARQAAKRTVEQRRLVQIVFQNPTLALNPREDVRSAIMRSLRLCPKAKRKSVDELLELVRLPGLLADSLPRELSGGERQRVAIARALAADPEVIVCDEITSALDVSVQAAILALLRSLREELGVSLLVITHDLGVVANVANKVLVIEHGVVCETGTTRAVLDTPTATYTRRLMQAAPSLAAAIGPAGVEVPVSAGAGLRLGREEDPQQPSGAT
jgi:peptide/nickel transport system ATP-binding protein